ncbi:MAG: Tfx family DNA-binding protein [Cuniculiplasma divulgatum]|nr:MAG: Tfx family DNA-binding protein [Cuniculiplasma divulgatum]
MNRKDSSRYGFLTERQMQILRLRKDGMKQGEIASRLGTTRQNIAILESRAVKKIEEAAMTLQMLEVQGTVCVTGIPAGIHILDAARAIIDEADRNGIRLKGNMVDLVSWLKSNMEGNIISGKIDTGVRVMILSDGRYLKLPAQ